MGKKLLKADISAFLKLSSTYWYWHFSNYRYLFIEIFDMDTRLPKFIGDLKEISA